MSNKTGPYANWTIGRDISRADLKALRTPGRTLSTRLRGYSSWLYGRDIKLEDVAELRDDAAIAGDCEQVAICDAAIGGDDEAWRECQRVIGEARAASVGN